MSITPTSDKYATYSLTESGNSTIGLSFEFIEIYFNVIPTVICSSLILMRLLTESSLSTPDKL